MQDQDRTGQDEPQTTADAPAGAGTAGRVLVAKLCSLCGTHHAVTPGSCPALRESIERHAAAAAGHDPTPTHDHAWRTDGSCSWATCSERRDVELVQLVPDAVELLNGDVIEPAGTAQLLADMTDDERRQLVDDAIDDAIDHAGELPELPCPYRDAGRPHGRHSDRAMIGADVVLLTCAGVEPADAVEQDERDDQLAGDADDELGTYVAMLDAYLREQRSWITASHAPLTFHLRKLARRLDADPGASAALSSAYLQTFTRLDKMRPGAGAPAGGAGDLPGQRSIFDELDD